MKALKYLGIAVLVVVVIAAIWVAPALISLAGFHFG